jgi:hypothetical protein
MMKLVKTITTKVFQPTARKRKALRARIDQLKDGTT